MKQNLFLDLTPRLLVFSAKMGPKPCEIGPLASKMGLKRVKFVRKRAELGIFSTFWIFPEQQDFFVRKCVRPLSRGERARNFELLFVAFYCRIVSTFEAEGYKMLQLEPIL